MELIHQPASSDEPGLIVVGTISELALYNDTIEMLGEGVSVVKIQVVPEEPHNDNLCQLRMPNYRNPGPNTDLTA